MKAIMTRDKTGWIRRYSLTGLEDTGLRRELKKGDVIDVAPMPSGYSLGAVRLHCCFIKHEIYNEAVVLLKPSDFQITEKE